MCKSGTGVECLPPTSLGFGRLSLVHVLHFETGLGVHGARVGYNCGHHALSRIEYDVLIIHLCSVMAPCEVLIESSKNVNRKHTISKYFSDIDS